MYANHSLPDKSPVPLNLLSLFLTFLKSGGLTVGDGYATIQPVRTMLVKRYRWMSEEDFSKHLAIVHAMPGIFNINLAAYLGNKLYGWSGSAAALLGMMLPPMIILIVFATFFNDFREFPAIQSFLEGARPAIVALIALPCLQMWRKSGISLSTVWIPVGAAISIGLLGVSPTYLIAGLAILGLIYGITIKSKE